MFQRLFSRIRERSPAYYDARVRIEHYADSRYWPAMRAMMAPLQPGPVKVLEIGCGTGQLAHAMHDAGLLASYAGFDFSAARVAQARRTVELRFEVADAYRTDLFGSSEYDTAVAMEFLEHVRDDLSVLARLRPGVRFVGTVPDFPYESHLRHFGSEREVLNRYASVFVDLEVTAAPGPGAGSVLWVLDGHVRGAYSS